MSVRKRCRSEESPSAQHAERRTPTLRVPPTVLRDRGEMPAVGLGTFRCKGGACSEAVERALRMGIRMIDTAESYRNEEEVALGIARSGVPREDIFLITKVSKESMKSRSAVRTAVLSSLRRLNTTYIDLILLHWPGTDNSNPISKLHVKARHQAWLELQDLRSTPRQHPGIPIARHVGVSNFTVAHLVELRSAEGVTLAPEVNQVECHPYARQEALREYCSREGIHLQAYTSLGRGLEPPKVLYGVREPMHPKLFDDVSVRALAKRAELSPSQLLLRWALSHGVSVIPKCRSAEHMKDNFGGLLRSPSELSAEEEEDRRPILPADVVGLLDALPLPAGYEAQGAVFYAYPPAKVPK